MKLKHTLALASVFLTVANANSQVVEAIDAQLTADSWFRSNSIIGVLATSRASGDRWIDARIKWGATINPYFYMPTPIEYANHTYGGYVRVKWIGPSPPGVGTYLGKFKVWSLNNAISSVQMLKSSPGARTLASLATLGGIYTNPLFANASTGSPGVDSSFVGDNVVINDEPLPSVGNNGIWHDMGEHATGANFQLESDGFYYANFPLACGQNFTIYFTGSAPSGWNTADVASGGGSSRVVYELIEVDGQPVL